MEQQKGKLDTNTIRLHFTYVVIILFIIIIGLITHHCYGDSRTFEAISFASAAISIILAVLTIVYSYYLNHRSTIQFLNVENSAKDIHAVSQHMLTSSSKVEESANSLSSNINDIITALNDINSTTSSTQCKIGEIEEKIKVFNQSSNNSPNQKDIDTLIDNAPMFGKWLLLGCVMAHNKGKSDKRLYQFYPIMIDNNLSSEYTSGFLVALQSMGIIDFCYYQTKHRPIRVNSIDKSITEEKIYNAIRVLSEKYPSNADEWSEKTEKIPNCIKSVGESLIIEKTKE